MKTYAGVIVVLVACVLSCGSRCSGGADEARERPDRDAAVDTAAVVSRPDSGSAAAASGGPRANEGAGPVERGSTPETRRLASVDQRVVDGNSSFAFRLVKKTCGSGETKNLFISPLSVSIALAMTYNGASGKTAREMAEVLGFAGIPLAELNHAMDDLAVTLERADSAVEMTVANSLWARRDVDFRAEFLERNKEFYDAEVSTLDFSDPGAPGVINDWVKGATNGLIDRMIESIPRDAVLYLLNAIYFKGRWQNAFDPAMTGDGEFYLVGGNARTVPMMRQSGSFRYADDAELQVVRLPYGGQRTAMYVFLPREPGALPVFVSEIDDGAFNEWTSRLVPRPGDVIIPRFKIDYECALLDALKAMGMRDPFDPSTADFSKMSDAGLFISAVKHRSVVDVNEEGTEAAAVTSVEITRTGVVTPADYFSFVADRPFFFVIRDDATGSVLFAGSLYDPSS
jgi:serine protease inhibitor